jgi:hypothetical protein
MRVRCRIARLQPGAATRVGAAETPVVVVASLDAVPLFRRKDADLVRDVPNYRRIMPVIMRSRNESTVFFEQRIDATRALEYVQRYNAAHERKISLFHLVVWSIVQTIGERPRLNRFTSGGRLYQRRGIWISYSAKKALDEDSPVFVVKREMQAAWTIDELAERMHGGVAEGRSDKPTYTDKELSFLLKLPIFLLRWLLKLLYALDRWNLLPHKFIVGDPLYASVFVVNLGSLKLDAAYHHNYEYGNIPIFVTVGRLHGSEAVLKWTFDERIEDGLYCARSLERLRERLESLA